LGATHDSRLQPDRENLPLYFNGALLTLKVLLISLAFGLVLAIPLALMRVSRSPLINVPCRGSTPT